MRSENGLGATSWQRRTVQEKLAPLILVCRGAGANDATYPTFPATYTRPTTTPLQIPLACYGCRASGVHRAAACRSELESSSLQCCRHSPERSAAAHGSRPSAPEAAPASSVSPD